MCALVTLLTAQENSLAESGSQENLSITRCFAHEKRRFSRNVATDVELGANAWCSYAIAP
ncbi:hypothetical protein NIHE120848_48910 [Klebsiella pneumoniae]|jgi:hypothetical protein|nr:hypothetical protein NIHE120848_48910 [Klebsiella pneumoniae]